MPEFWFWLLLVLLFLAVFAWPLWPHTRTRWPYEKGGTWRYLYAGSAALLALMILVAFWLGLIVIWWPWIAYR